MRLPETTTYEQWDALRRERFTKQNGFDDVTVQHNRYETCLFMYESGNSGIAMWEIATGYCYTKTKRQAIFSVLSRMRNYMVHALDAWEFNGGENIDAHLPWGVMFTNEEGQ